jgi:hypothetical protein
MDNDENRLNEMNEFSIALLTNYGSHYVGIILTASAMLKKDYESGSLDLNTEQETLLEAILNSAKSFSEIIRENIKERQKALSRRPGNSMLE